MKPTRILLLTLLAFALALCASKCGAAPVKLDDHDVLMVFMLANSPNNAGASPTVADYAADIARMKAAGATGAVVDCNGWTAMYQERFEEFGKAAAAANFPIMGCADFGTMAEAQIGSLVKAEEAQPTSIRASDGTLCQYVWGGSPAIYAALQRDTALLAAEGLPVYVIANDEAAYLANPWIRGVGSYDMGASAATLVARMARLASERRSGDLLMLGVSAGMNDPPRVFGGSWPYLHTLLGEAAALKPDALLVSTANDWAEMTGVLDDPPAKNAAGKPIINRSAVWAQSVPDVATYTKALVSN